MLITIEGIDGSGKATQTKLLVAHLKKEKYSVQTLDFPQDNNFFGKLVRRYLAGEFGPAAKVSPYLASVLYAADRWEASAKIRHWIDTGNVVVLDRYVESNLIHQSTKMQGEEQDKFVQWVMEMEYGVLKLPKPELTLLLHIPMQVSYELMRSRGRKLDGLEGDMAHQEAAERQCLKLAATLQWQKIECTENGKLLSPEVIHQQVWKVVDQKLKA
ncbi:MAG: dTMP kinase [Patescibacteria group bacterium]|nr:dTMP kinase [Patescibacteria group bacterium]